MFFQFVFNYFQTDDEYADHRGHLQGQAVRER